MHRLKSVGHQFGIINLLWSGVSELLMTASSQVSFLDILEYNQAFKKITNYQPNYIQWKVNFMVQGHKIMGLR